MRQPDVYTATRIQQWDVSSAKTFNGPWKPARPDGVPFFRPWRRMKIAWKVFTGKMDALDWEGH
jgi:hypothetical protein